MLIMATILHLGKSSLPKKHITDDDVERISLCLKVLSELSPLMNDIFNKECRKSLSHMLAVRLEEEKLSQKVGGAEEPLGLRAFLPGDAQMFRHNFITYSNLCTHLLLVGQRSLIFFF